MVFVAVVSERPCRSPTAKRTENWKRETTQSNLCSTTMMFAGGGLFDSAYMPLIVVIVYCGMYAFSLLASRQVTLPQTFSIEQEVHRLADEVKAKGIDSREMQDLRKHGFFVTRFVPVWYVCLAERLALLRKRKFEMLFLKKSGKQRERWDAKREISYLVELDVLHKLMSGPIEQGMKALGMLDVVGGEGSREIGGCSAIKSSPRPLALIQPGLQGMHSDKSPCFQWKNEFGFSCITAGSREAFVDVYPGSFDGGKGPSGVPTRVHLSPAETLVFTSLTRHRGGAFPYESLRFFVSFEVRAAAARLQEEGDGAEFDTTSALQKQSEEEPDALSWELWQCLHGNND